jgi:entericidin A
LIFLSVFLTIKGGFMKKLISVWGILLMFFLVAGTGCNTMEGAGKDVEKAGEKVKDAAD